jgi:hypothetical protein
METDDTRRTPGLTLKAVARQQLLLGVLRRPVGPEVAVARPARAARGEPRHRPPGHQPQTLGFPKMTDSLIPSHFEYYWRPPAGLGLMTGFPFSRPYEDEKLKAR